MADITTTEIRIAGIKSLLRSSGPANATEAVVFLHGNPGSSEDWLDLIPRVGEFARVIAPDMPGYGKADRPKDFDYTVDGYARHLAAMLDELSVNRAHLVLHDFGGPWGMAWACEHPQSIASITLINIGVLPGYRWHKFARVWRTPLLGELFQLGATRGAFKLLINADNPKPFPDAFVDRMFDDSDWGMKRAVLKLYRATSDLGGLSERFGTGLKALNLPALVVWGDGDKYLSVTYAEAQKRYFNADVHVLPGCGHWPMIDEPERVRDLVVPFLRAQVNRSASASVPKATGAVS